MFSFKSSGSFNNLEEFLNKMRKGDIFKVLDAYGQMGVDALAAYTPVDSGLAASSWGYFVKSSLRTHSITWTNHDIENGFPVAVMLQYGYSTGTGGYVQGRDYINPAMQPIFDQIADGVWKAVVSA